MAVQGVSSQEVSDLLSAAESAATIVALAVGGVWAYFKFVKDRVYRPRLDVTIEAGTVLLEDKPHVACRLSVKNIGTSKVRLLQEGTGLRVSSMAGMAQNFIEPDWEAKKVHEVFKEHEWIESSETIRHEVIFQIASESQLPLLLEARLVCRVRGNNNISIHSRKLATLTKDWEDDDRKEVDHGRPTGT